MTDCNTLIEGDLYIETSTDTAVHGDGSIYIRNDINLEGSGTGGTTTTLTSTQTTDRTLNLPDADDTLVGKATTDTLTNKDIRGTTNVVSADYLKTTGADVDVVSAAPPTAGQVLRATTATTATWQTLDTGGDVKVAILWEEQLVGTATTTPLTGGWDKVTFNQTAGPLIGTEVTLSGSQITLTAGKYVLNARCPAFKVEKNQSRLYNVTDASVVQLGSSEDTGNGNTTKESHLTAYIDIAGTKVFEIQHFGQKTTGGAVFGRPSGIDSEIYAMATIFIAV